MPHALITGASSGLGSALAVLLGKRGYTLTLLGRDAERLEHVADRCRAAGNTVVTARVDVADADGMVATLLEADQRQPLDLLIANAGIGGSGVLAPPTGEPVELARGIVDVNFLGVVNSVAPLLPRFVARGRGDIAIVSSLAGMEGLADSPVYCASKAAARVYGHGLRRLLAAKGVRVTVVCPGFMTTPMSASLPMQPLFPVEAERAAAYILRGIERGRPEIVFPWQLRWVAHLTSVLPRAATDRILALGRAHMET